MNTTHQEAAARILATSRPQAIGQLAAAYHERAHRLGVTATLYAQDKAAAKRLRAQSFEAREIAEILATKAVQP